MISEKFSGQIVALISKDRHFMNSDCHIIDFVGNTYTAARQY